MSRHSRQPPLISLAMVAAVIVTAIFAIWLVRHFIHLQESLIAQRAEANAADVAPNNDADLRLTAGVAARITTGARVAEVWLPSADFALNSGESLDASVQAGPFRAEFTVRFWSGNVRQARLGAEIQGGKLMILHSGRPVLAEAAGGDGGGRSVMSTIAMPVNLARDVDQITVIFENDGRRPCAMKLLWQPWSPDPAGEPLPLPSPR